MEGSRRRKRSHGGVFWRGVVDVGREEQEEESVI